MQRRGKLSSRRTDARDRAREFRRRRRLEQADDRKQARAEERVRGNAWFSRVGRLFGF